MVDHIQTTTVCCMCGDVGFPDKLFHCSNCRNRHQHSYCSNYYSEHAEPIEVCDWCRCEQKSSSTSKQGNSSASNSPKSNKSEQRSAYSAEKTKRHNRDEGGSGAEKATGKPPSPRPTPRRYKLLKDVMC